MLQLLAVLFHLVLHQDEGTSVLWRRQVVLGGADRMGGAFCSCLDPLKLGLLARVHCHYLLPRAVEIGCGGVHEFEALLEAARDGQLQVADVLLLGVAGRLRKAGLVGRIHALGRLRQHALDRAEFAKPTDAKDGPAIFRLLVLLAHVDRSIRVSLPSLGRKVRHLTRLGGLSEQVDVVYVDAFALVVRVLDWAAQHELVNVVLAILALLRGKRLAYGSVHIASLVLRWLLAVMLVLHLGLIKDLLVVVQVVAYVVGAGLIG